MQEAQPIAGESEPGTTAFVASDLGLAAGVFLTIFVGLTAALVGSAFLFADLDVLWHEGRIERLARFDLFLVLIAAYTSAATLVAQRGAGRDFRALRDVVDTPKAEWNAWQARFLDRRAGWRSALLGAIVGLGVQRLGSVFGSISPEQPWMGLVLWAALLNAAVFAGLGLLARWSVLEIRALRAIGRHVRVSLLDRRHLAPFVRTGLRSALLWLIGSSLAMTLLVDVNSPVLVIPVLCGTVGLAIAAMLLPSRGLHERLHATKQAELAWVRSEIARAREALGQAALSGDAAGRLPALLAWEARVDAASTWAFDAPSLLRFSLLLLVPLGSWLGGALVERLVDSALR